MKKISIAMLSGLVSGKIQDFRITLANQSRQAGLRTLTEHLMEVYFIPYGCWCNFDESNFNKPGHGHGPPMDEWDASCKQLVDGYECAVIDAQNRGDYECEPWNREYATLGTGIAETLIHQMCIAVSGGDKCTEDACVVETYFANRVGNTLIPGQPPGFANIAAVHQPFRHDQGFDIESNCPRRSSMEEDVTKTCCGTHPNRIPFRQSSERDCCIAADGIVKIFNTGLQLCCDDGSVGSIGSCT